LLKIIRRQESIRAGDRLAVAVSGGADSVALLCLLLELRSELGIVLSVAHVNHQLRGEASDGDQEFVARCAHQHGLELHVLVAPVAGSGPNSGIEAAAREQRYSFFRRLASAGLVGKIATAHTLDDQAETVLLRILFEQQGRIVGEVVRPLLSLRRAALLEFLRHRGQSWREDSSNRELAFLRNRVRHRLLPLIVAELGEPAIAHLAELAEIARGEELCWELGRPRAGIAEPGTKPEPGAHSPSLDVPQLLALPLGAQRRLLRAWLEANASNLPISFRLIEETLEFARGAGSGKLELPGGHFLGRAQASLWLEPVSSGSCLVADYEYALAIPGGLQVPELGARFEAQLVDARDVPAEQRGQLLEVGRVPNKVVIRNWRAADRFWPAHTSAAKKVKELLSDRHATGTEKKLWPVAVAEGCGLVWLRGFAAPAAFRAPIGAGQAIWIREITGMI
jgi:tRNA(Ile)-lysidine synthase